MAKRFAPRTDTEGGSERWRKTAKNRPGIRGWLRQLLNKPREAIEHYGGYLEMMRKIEYHEGEGTALWGLGEIYNSLGEVRKAIECLQSSLVVLEQIEWPNVERVRARLTELKERLR